MLSTGSHAGSPSLLPAATSSPSGATSLSTLKAWSAPTTASTMADTLLRPHPFSLSGPMKKTRMPTQKRNPGRRTETQGLNSELLIQVAMGTRRTPLPRWTVRNLRYVSIHSYAMPTSGSLCFTSTTSAVSPKMIV